MVCFCCFDENSCDFPASELTTQERLRQSAYFMCGMASEKREKQGGVECRKQIKTEPLENKGSVLGSLRRWLRLMRLDR